MALEKVREASKIVASPARDDVGLNSTFLNTTRYFLVHLLRLFHINPYIKCEGVEYTPLPYL
jgi:hypothetical protein